MFNLVLLGIGSQPALAKVNVFTCAPEWQALVQEIGRDNVDVYTASNANQDVHHMHAKPSLLTAIQKADLVVCSGASLEIEWLPVLLEKTDNIQIQEGGIGSIMAADYVPLLGMMENIDHMGHIHPEGNPHVHLDPNNILTVSKIIAERLAEIDYSNSESYLNNVATFETTWKKLLEQWKEEAKPLSEKKVVVYHQSWLYLLNWLGIEAITSLEPRSGIPPTAAHLEKVLKDIEDKNVIGIIVAPFENDKAAKWLSEQSNLQIIRLPFTVGGNKESTDLESLFENTIQILKK